MKVYALFFTCGDYYCGCPGGAEKIAGHLAGIYSTIVEAGQRREKAEATESGSRDYWIEEVEVA